MKQLKNKTRDLEQHLIVDQDLIEEKITALKKLITIEQYKEQYKSLKRRVNTGIYIKKQIIIKENRSLRNNI